MYRRSSKPNWIDLRRQPAGGPDQLALDLLASSVDHDDWFREEVEKGGRRLGPAGCWTMTMSSHGSTSDTAADARSLDH